MSTANKKVDRSIRIRMYRLHLIWNRKTRSLSVQYFHLEGIKANVGEKTISGKFPGRGRDAITPAKYIAVWRRDLPRLSATARDNVLAGATRRGAVRPLCFLIVAAYLWRHNARTSRLINSEQFKCGSVARIVPDLCRLFWMSFERCRNEPGPLTSFLFSAKTFTARALVQVCFSAEIWSVSLADCTKQNNFMR